MIHPPGAEKLPPSVQLSEYESVNGDAPARTLTSRMYTSESNVFAAAGRISKEFAKALIGAAFSTNKPPLAVLLTTKLDDEIPRQ